MINDRPVADEFFDVEESDGQFKLHIHDQSLVAGEITARVNWSERVIRVTAERDPLQAMGSAVGSHSIDLDQI